MSNDPFNVPYLRNHMLQGRDVQLTVRAGANAVFFKDSTGTVFADRITDLSRMTRCNDTDRRAWCALTGVKVADLRASVKEKRARRKAEANQWLVDDAVRTLESSGYRVTKRRKA